MHRTVEGVASSAARVDWDAGKWEATQNDNAVGSLGIGGLGVRVYNCGVKRPLEVWGLEVTITRYKLRVTGYGSRVKGHGLKTSDFRFRVSGFGFRVSSFGFQVQDLRSRIWDLGLRELNLGFWRIKLRLRFLGRALWAQGLSGRDSDLGF